MVISYGGYFADENTAAADAAKADDDDTGDAGERKFVGMNRPLPAPIH